MNLNTLNIKYFATIFLIVLMCFINNLNAQVNIGNDKIEIIVGSYKYEYNANSYKIKLKKEGFKKARVLAKKDEFHRVSINQFKTLKGINKFIDSIGINKTEYWLFYQKNHKASSEFVRNENDSLKSKSATKLSENTKQESVSDSLDYSE